MKARILALAALVNIASPAQAGETIGMVTPGGTVSVPVVSLKQARFKSVIRQQHDFSCGSAAVATLLTYHYGRPTSEEDAFRAMWDTGDQDLIRRQGFSLYDMKRYIETRNLRADGFRVGLDKLAEVGVPAISLITTKGYSHFVVIKGIKDGDVLVGDPALGIKAIPQPAFEAMWQGVVFVVRDDIELGRKYFNDSEEWAARRKAPFGTALSRHGLATFSIAMPGLFEF